MHLLASSTKQTLQRRLLAVGMASNQLLRGVFPFPLYTCVTHWLLSKASQFIHYICHVEIKLNDVIKVAISNIWFLTTFFNSIV